MVRLTIHGTKDVIRGLDALAAMDNVRKRDISAIFSKNMKILRTAARNEAPKSKRLRTYSKQYASRRHEPGTLKRSLKFKTSKRFKHRWYIVADRGRKAKYDAWYTHFLLGTSQGQEPNRFMDRAWASVGNSVMNGIANDLQNLIQKVWRGK